MSKPQSTGTTADDLRAATREANGQMKDLQAAVKEGRALLAELRLEADAYVSKVQGAIDETLVRSVSQIRQTIGEVAAQGLKQMDERLGVYISEAVEELGARMVEATENLDPEKREAIELLRAPLLKLLADVGLDPQSAHDVTIEQIPTSAPYTGVDMTINDRHIAVCPPVKIEDLSPDAQAKVRDKMLTTHDVKRKCRTCTRDIWVSALKVKAAKDGADLMCMLCVGRLMKMVRDDGNAGDAIIMHQSALVTSRSRASRVIAAGTVLRGKR